MRALLNLVAALWFAGTAVADGVTARQAAAIDAIFAGWTSPRSPGCAVALIRGRTITHFKGYGLADVERDAVWTPQSAFHPGSNYKQFYAASIVLLARQGKLSLDDDIRKHIPEMPDYGSVITVRDLLTHTHGLRETPEALRELVPADRMKTDDDLLRLIARQRGTEEKPGTKYRYGNTGPFLAGIIIERASGVRRPEFIGRYLLEPLGMKNTAFGRDPRTVPPAVPGYVRQSDGTFQVAVAANSRTTFADLARWNEHFDSAGAEWRPVFEQLITPTRLRDGTTLDATMGLRVRPYRGLPRVWAPGGARGFRAMFMRFPEAGLTIALGCNREDLDPVKTAESIADVVLETELTPLRQPMPVRLTSRQLRAVAGTYVSSGAVIRVVVRNGTLFLASDRGEFPMTAVAPDRFVFPEKPFIIRDAAVEARITHDRGGVRRLELRTVWEPMNFVGVQPVTASAVDGADYAGRYASEETESSVEIVKRANGLVMKAPRGEDALQPVAADVFRAGDFILRFARIRGTVTAVDLSRGNLTRLTFTRKR